MQKILLFLALPLFHVSLQAMDPSKPKPTVQDLCTAIRNDQTDTVIRLLHEGADVTASLPETGDTPLHVAFMQEKLNTTIINLLLQKGARETAFNQKRLTPVSCIRYAWLTRQLVKITQGRVANSATQIAALLDEGADVNGLPGKYMPLHCAIAWGSPENVKVLLERGANPHATGSQNYSCLHMVGQMGFHEERTIAIARMLLDAGASLDAKSEGGKTPIDFVESRKTKEWQPLIDLYKTYQTQTK